MTLKERNALILKALKEQTKRDTASPETARKVLIKEGIYTKSGNLSQRFGGRRSAKSAA